MSGINRRSKGNRNERNIADLLTQWTGKKFQRTPSSGGLQWKTSFSKGDVVCTVEGHFFPFCVEGKFYKEIDFSHLLIAEIHQPLILKFWNQCERDARKCNKIPMLMMRYNRLPADFFFMALPFDYFMYLMKHTQDVGKVIFKEGFRTLIWHTKSGREIILLDSRVFLKTRYKTVKRITKQYLKNGQEKR